VGQATQHYTNSNDGVFYIQGFNVEENSFNLTGIKKVTSEFHRRNSRSSLREGDLLTIQTGEVGITTIVPKKLEGSNCHALIITRFKQEIIFPKFYSYYFNSSFYHNQLKEIETGTTMKHINVRDMAILQVLIPPPPRTKSDRQNPNPNG
jgi:type I restriction enzyme S subunit